MKALDLKAIEERVTTQELTVTFSDVQHLIAVVRELRDAVTALVDIVADCTPSFPCEDCGVQVRDVSRHKPKCAVTKGGQALALVKEE